jgi:DNA adenine methylase
MKPFLKWAGGKYKIIDKINEHLPQGNRLIEPFMGSGAVFMNTHYDNYLLGDSNFDLINVFKHLQEKGSLFIDYAKTFFTVDNNQELVFYDFRKLFNQTDDTTLKAALFIYLNRHCFNGLCRYNAKGGFNVPFGRYAAPMFPEKELLAFYEKSKKVQFQCTSFENTMNQAIVGDVIYCDPPYAPLSTTANFTAYTQQGFTKKDQEVLGDLARDLVKRGIYIVISNHDTEFTRSIYKEAAINSFDVQRFIASQSNSRIKAPELLAVFQ